MRHMREMLLLVLIGLWAVAPAQAGWLDALVRAGSKTAKHSLGALDNVASHIKLLPHKADGHALAATATPEGHWRFVNRAGETVTAASPDELKRALSILAPGGAASAEAKVALYLTEESVFLHRSALKDLPKAADLHVLVGKDSYRLLRQGDGDAVKLYAELRPSLVAELTERRLFDEAVWQLARPLNKANIRVVTLEPGGPAALSSVPRFDPATKRALTDAIDPDRLRHSMSAVRGQTVLVTGRVEGEFLYFKPASGPERSLLVRDLTAAAEAADANLVILQTASARQPGARNWLWQRTEVAGLDKALQHATVSDFLNALIGDRGRMVVMASPSGTLRTQLELRPLRGLADEAAPSPITGAFADIVSDLAGRVITTGVDGTMRSAEYERELEDRLIPGIPSAVQFAYLGFLVIGLFGLPTALGWWRRVWPQEVRSEYGNIFGYWAASLVRSSLFFLIFMPLVAPATAMITVFRQLLDILMAPVRFWRWLTRRSPSAA